MEWKFKEGTPIYTQIVDAMTMQIASHSYEPGEKLPSVRDLALEAGVNPNTMQRAMTELERRGLVFSERTSGRFVTKEEDVLKQLRETLSEEFFRELEERLRGIGMADGEIRSSAVKWLDHIG